MNSFKKSVQQIKQEPLELLRSARSQVTGEQVTGNEQIETKQNSEIPKEEQEYKKRQSEQDGRHLQALESELKDIRRQKMFNDLMRRIQAGEDIPLEEFTELSFEQRDVLKAQMEAVKTRNQKPVTSELPKLSLKIGRKMGGGQKGAAKKEATRVEKPVPPSG